MFGRILKFLVLVGLTALSEVGSLYFSLPELNRVTDTLLAITISYGVFKIITLGLINKKIYERKAKFLFRRLNNAAFYLVTLLWALTVWVKNPETLLLSYGLISAAVALALQDVFKNLMGGFTLLGSRSYQVGDRIEVDGLVGDVIKINLLYTTVMEVRNWVDGDQPTGRLSLIPNSKITNEIVHNYTKDHKFIWDEITLPITYDSNWQKAGKIAKEVMKEKQIDINDKVEKDIKKLTKKYFLEEKPTEPNIYVKITDNWAELNARYITNTLNRRVTKSDLNEEILKRLEKEEDIQIASQTLRIYQD